MQSAALTRQAVIDFSLNMPSFPKVVSEIIATVDDPDGSLNALVHSINHDPLIAARVLAAANNASARVRRSEVISDTFAATALVGMSRVREIALVSCVNGFLQLLGDDPSYRQLWLHSMAVGVAAQEIAVYTERDVSVESALIAGLLHNIGQYWFYAYDAKAYRNCMQAALAEAVPLQAMERLHFGTDHAMVGAWLLGHWELPANICDAVNNHRAPDAHIGNLLVPLVHVAEVVSDALDLADSQVSRVSHVSAPACRALGLIWDAEVHALFGRIKARSRHANAFFTAA